MAQDLEALEERLSLLEALRWVAIEWQDAKYHKHTVTPEQTVQSLLDADAKRLVIAPDFD